MISVNSLSQTRSLSPLVEKPHPHRLTLLFGMVIVSCVVALGIYLYCWLQRSFEGLGNQALERKEFQKAADFFTRWLQASTPDAEKEKKLQRLMEGCEKALSSPNLAVQSQARFLILRGEANLGLSKPVEALQDFTAVLELGSGNLNAEDFSRLIQGCEKALLSSNLEVQSRAEVHILKGRANLGLNKPSEASQEFKTALGLLSLNLKPGEFSIVIHCCECALKSSSLEGQFQAQFWMLKGLAYLSLNDPSEAKHCFCKVIELSPKKAKFLVLAYYFLGLVSKETGDDFYAAECCEKALDELTEQDIELKTEILTLRALSLLDSKQFLDAIEAANSALKLLTTDKAPKEILSALYFCLASSYCAQKNYTNGFPYFTQALENSKNDPFLRAYILSYRGYYHSLAAKNSAEAQSQAEKDFQEASQCKADDHCVRSELLRCMMWPMFEKLGPEETPLTRLAKKIGEDRKAHSVPEPQE